MEERSQDIAIAPLGTGDLADADRVFRLAFGTRLGLPDPLRFAEGAEMIRSRAAAEAGGAFKAVVRGELVGSAFVRRWGTFGVFGPLTVRPDFWDRGVGSLLWEACAPLLEPPAVTHAALFTTPDSIKHVHLYRKHGFWPRFLTALTEKQVASAGVPVETSSSHRPNLDDLLAECADLTGELYPGLDLSAEIRVVADHPVGDVVLVRERGRLTGFAVCHAGPGSEAVPGTCYVKFAAARAGDGAAARLGALLDACEAFAADRGSTRLEVGASFGREAACRVLSERGHRVFRHGLAMHRPNDDAFDRPDVLALDDRR